MIAENVDSLKIHKLKQEQYEAALASGMLDENALYLTPFEDAIPKKVSDLENDAGYVTADDIPSIPSNVSEFVNDTGYATESYVDEMLGNFDVSVATATGTTSGIVKLSDATDSDSGVAGGVAATPLAVKNAIQAAADNNSKIINTYVTFVDQYDTSLSGYYGITSAAAYLNTSEYICLSLGGTMNNFSKVYFDTSSGSYKYNKSSYEPYTIQADSAGTYDVDFTIVYSSTIGQSTSSDTSRFEGLYVFSEDNIPPASSNSLPTNYKNQLMTSSDSVKFLQSTELSSSVRVTMDAGDVLVAIVNLGVSTSSDTNAVSMAQITGSVQRVA